MACALSSRLPGQSGMTTTAATNNAYVVKCDRSPHGCTGVTVLTGQISGDMRGALAAHAVKATGMAGITTGQNAGMVE